MAIPQSWANLWRSPIQLSQSRDVIDKNHALATGTAIDLALLVLYV